ncbi:MAG: DUF58 domain-containing protein [Longimicrobiaceae bacterium]
MLPTPRLLLALAAAAPLWLLGWRAALAADLLILGAALLDGVLARGSPSPRVERVAPTRVSLGSLFPVRLEVVNPTPRPLTLQVTDDLPGGLEREGADRWEAIVAPGDALRVTYTVGAAERGAHALGDVHLRVRGPLGLVWREQRIPRADPLSVQPGIEGLRRQRLLGLRRLRDAGVRATRERGEGGSWESLREYVRGDDPRGIDWKATARRGEPMVRLREAERSQNVLLVIDAGRLMTERIGDRERIDHALSAALLLAEVATRHGDRVGLMVFAESVRQWIPPRRLPLGRVSEALGAVQPTLAEPNYPAAFLHLARRLRRRSLLVVFSDVIDPRASAALVAHLGRAAGRHLPLLIALRNPDLDVAAEAVVTERADALRRAAAEELLQARAVALAAMRRSGALVADVAAGGAVAATVNRYLEVKRRGLL